MRLTEALVRRRRSSSRERAVAPSAQWRAQFQNESSLRGHDISIHFDGLVVLDCVQFELRRGEVLGLIGPNGAGKTTLVNTLTGFQLPSSGSVLLHGNDITGLPPHAIARQGIARTFQSGRLFRNLTVADNIHVSGVNNGLSRHDARTNAIEILTWMGAADLAEVSSGTLPYAFERRVGIARALGSRPHFILLDEPAAGMSDEECDDLMRLISEIPRRFEAGVLLIEHNMRVVAGVCNRVQVLDGGRTIAVGTPDEIWSDRAVVAAYLSSSDSE